MKIGTKLLMAFLGIAILLTVTGIVLLLESRDALSKAAFNQLESIREDKKAQVEAFFTERKSDMHVLLETVTLFRQNAFQKLESLRQHRKIQLEQYFRERLHNITLASQNVSISQALIQFEEALHLDGPNKEKTWQAVAKQFDVELRQFKEKHGYHNLFLIAKDGDVVYSASQNTIVGQNMLSNQWQNSSLSQMFQKGLKSVAIQDFSPCVLSEGNQHVLLFAAPVFQDRKLIGVLVLCITPKQINTIMQQPQGLGQSGEAYLVGKNNAKIAYRSDQLVSEKGQNRIGIEKSGEDVNKALTGSTGTEIKISSTGIVKITSYAPLQIEGLHWGIIVTIGLEEALTPIRLGQQESFFAKYMVQYGYYDLFLIHPKGRIFYTVKHESDYNNNQ